MIVATLSGSRIHSVHFFLWLLAGALSLAVWLEGVRTPPQPQICDRHCGCQAGSSWTCVFAIILAFGVGFLRAQWYLWLLISTSVYGFLGYSCVAPGATCRPA